MRDYVLSVYCWLLKNNGLNCAIPLICRVFSVNTYWCPTQSKVNWIYRWVTACTKGWLLSYTWIFHAPHPGIVKGSTVWAHLNPRRRKQYLKGFLDDIFLIIFFSWWYFLDIFFCLGHCGPKVGTFNMYTLMSYLSSSPKI